MGSINRIFDPKYWKKNLEAKSKIIEDDIIYKMIIGDGEDYQLYEISEFISKCNYENIINGNYTIKVFPYAEISVLLFDERQELIPLVRGTEISFDKLDNIQKECVNKENSKTLNLTKVVIKR